MLPGTTRKKYGCPGDGDGSLESKSIPERSLGDAGKELRQKEAPALTWGSGSRERSHVFTHGNYIFCTAINCSQLFSPTRLRGCFDTYGKGGIGPDPWGKQSDPQRQDLPTKHSTHKASDQQGVTWSKLSEACICPPHKIPHLLQSVRLFHVRARPVTGISHRVDEGRRDPALPSPRMLQLMMGQSKPTKRSPGQKPNSRTAQPSSPQSNRRFHRCTPDSINGNKASLPGDMPLGNSLQKTENSKPELNILVSMSYKIC